VNITKHEHTIIIGILSAVIGIGIGGYFSQEEVVVKPPKVVIEQPKELTPAQARKLAYSKLDDFGWTSKQFTCLNQMWGKESAWNYKAASPTKDHGIPQRHMSNNTKAEIHAFQIDPVAQIQWGLKYIDSRYGSPCRAWEFWKRNHWY
jgi:hypothetical protein